MSTLPQDNAEDVNTGEETTSQAEAQETEQAVPEGIVARYAGRTAVGLVREHNEDNFVIADLAADEPAPREQVCTDAVTDSGLMFAVCDGMGGAAAGEVASQMAVDILLEALRRGGPPGDRDALAQRLVSAVEEAGKRIFAAAQSERAKRGMGTTATVAALLDKVLFLAEVGDSRAYLLREGTMRQLTKDQSLVNQLIEAGHLTPEEADAFEHSNIILQALGTSDSVQVDLTFVELRRGDRLMLCSDGLSGLVHDDSICDALIEFTDPVECTARLVQYAEAGGGHDNITVIVADFDGDALALPKDADAFGYMQYPLVPTDAAATVSDHSDPPAPTHGLRSTIPAPAEPEGGVASWLVAGVAALVVGGAVLALSSQPQAEETAAPAVELAAEPVREEPPPPATAEKVAVRVYSDVERATLLVNGESHGTLPAGGELPLELSPGAYRFEAESDGNIAAVAVVTVRPDVPLDVYLNLPEGTELGEDDEDGEGQADEAAAAERGAEQAPRAAKKPVTSQKPAAAKAAPKAPEASGESAAPAATPKPAPAPKPAPTPSTTAPAAPKTEAETSPLRITPVPSASKPADSAPTQPTTPPATGSPSEKPAPTPPPALPDNPF